MPGELAETDDGVARPLRPRPPEPRPVVGGALGGGSSIKGDCIFIQSPWPPADPGDVALDIGPDIGDGFII